MKMTKEELFKREREIAVCTRSPWPKNSFIPIEPVGLTWEDAGVGRISEFTFRVCLPFLNSGLSVTSLYCIAFHESHCVPSAWLLVIHLPRINRIIWLASLL